MLPYGCQVGVEVLVSHLAYTDTLVVLVVMVVRNPSYRPKVFCLARLNRASRICGAITKYLTFISLESQKEKRKKTELKKYLKKIIAENLPSLAKDINQSDQYMVLCSFLLSFVYVCKVP